MSPEDAADHAVPGVGLGPSRRERPAGMPSTADGAEARPPHVATHCCVRQGQQGMGPPAGLSVPPRPPPPPAACPVRGLWAILQFKGEAGRPQRNPRPRGSPASDAQRPWLHCPSQESHACRGIGQAALPHGPRLLTACRSLPASLLAKAALGERVNGLTMTPKGSFAPSRSTVKCAASASL